MSETGPSDKQVYHAANLETAEIVRKLLLSHKLRPCVFVYPGPNAEYDIKVSTEWGGCPSDEFVAQLKAHISAEVPAQDQRPS